MKFEKKNYLEVQISSVFQVIFQIFFSLVFFKVSKTENFNLSLKSTLGHYFFNSLNGHSKKLFENMEMNFENLLGKHLVVAK